MHACLQGANARTLERLIELNTDLMDQLNESKWHQLNGDKAINGAGAAATTAQGGKLCI